MQVLDFLGVHARGALYDHGCLREVHDFLVFRFCGFFFVVFCVKRHDGVVVFVDDKLEVHSRHLVEVVFEVVRDIDVPVLREVLDGRHEREPR